MLPKKSALFISGPPDGIAVLVLARIRNLAALLVSSAFDSESFLVLARRDSTKVAKSIGPLLPRVRRISKVSVLVHLVSQLVHRLVLSLSRRRLDLETLGLDRGQYDGHLSDVAHIARLVSVDESAVLLPQVLELHSILAKVLSSVIEDETVILSSKGSQLT